MSYPGLIDYDISDLRQEFGGRKMPPGYEILVKLIDNADTALYDLHKIGMGKSDAYRLIDVFITNAESELECIVERGQS